MTDFIHSILVYPFLDTSDYVAMSIGVAMWLLFIAIVSAIVHVIIHLIDTADLHVYVGLSIVDGKGHVPERMTKRKVYNPNIKQYTEEEYGYCECWYLVFKIDDRYDKILVTEWYYNKYTKGDITEVAYTSSRLWNTLHIKEYT